MKRFAVSTLKPGTTIWQEYFTQKGDLVLTPGTIITTRHIEQLKRRNIFDLFVLDQPAAEHAVDPTIMQRSRAGAPLSSIAIEFERLRQESLDALMNRPIATELDAGLRRGRLADRPVGAAIRPSDAPFTARLRGKEYIDTVVGLYQTILSDIHAIHDEMLAGHSMEFTVVRRIAEKLLQLSIEDKDILLALTSFKNTSGDYLYGHALNTCILTMSIAMTAGYNREQSMTIAAGALLHDVGMLLVPADIRNKTGKLDKSEFAEIQKHPLFGVQVLKKIRRLPEAVSYILYQSHERENGSGYPRQRTSPLIHRFAKILQIADVYEALTAPRHHRGAYTPFEAVEMLIRMTQKGLLSHSMIKTMLACTSLFPVGSLVQLSDGRTGRVIHGNDQYIHRPVVSIVRDTRDMTLLEKDIYHVDLAQDETVSVIRALSPHHLGDVEFLRGF